MRRGPHRCIERLSGKRKNTPAAMRRGCCSGPAGGQARRRRERTMRPVKPDARMPMAAHSPGSGTAAVSEPLMDELKLLARFDEVFEAPVNVILP